MHVIPTCDLVAIEKRAVLGVGSFPAAHGPAAWPIARALAKAEAAAKYPTELRAAIRALRNEYQCTDPECPMIVLAQEAAEEFSWRRIYERRIGADIVAVWMLEMEIFIQCLPKDAVPPGPQSPQHPGPEYGYFDEKLKWVRAPQRRRRASVAAAPQPTTPTKAGAKRTAHQRPKKPRRK